MNLNNPTIVDLVLVTQKLLNLQLTIQTEQLLVLLYKSC